MKRRSLQLASPLLAAIVLVSSLASARDHHGRRRHREPAGAPPRQDDDCKADPCTPCEGATPCTPVAVAGTAEADAKAKEKEKETSHDGPSVSGLRVSRTVVRGSDANGRETGLMFAFQTEKYKTWSILTTRASTFGMLGGGSGGLEGGFGGSLSAGVRAPLAATHGPFARVGAAGSLQGNDAFYYSYLELPELQAGYQFQDGQSTDEQKVTVEVGARTGAIITGRFTTGQNTRNMLNGFEWGGYGAVHLPFGRIDLKYARLPGSAGAVDMLGGIACGHLGKTLALCVDGMLLRGNVPDVSPVQKTEAIYIGGTVGLLTW